MFPLIFFRRLRWSGSFAVCSAFFVVFGLLLLAGCGSGNQKSGNGPSPAPSGGAISYTGRATVRIAWPLAPSPSTSRLIPSGAFSVVVEITGEPSGKTFRHVLSRATTPYPPSYTFTGLPVGIPLTVHAAAFPYDNGTGVAQALAEIPVTFHEGDNPLDLTLETTITQFAVSQTPVTVAVGETKFLGIVPKNAAGEVVMVGPDALRITSSNEAVGKGQGFIGSVLGISPGTFTATVTNNEAGSGAAPVSAQVEVIVVPAPSPTPTPVPTPTPPRYDAVVLGQNVYPTAINASGAITGYYYPAYNAAARAFRLNAGETSITAANDLGAPPEGMTDVQGVAINDSGQILVRASFVVRRDANNLPILQNRALVVPAGGTLANAFDLGTLGNGEQGTNPVALNNAGQVAGTYDNGSVLRGFRVNAGQTLTAGADIGTLGGASTTVTGMNDSGQVVGASDTNEPNPPRAFFRTEPNAPIVPIQGVTMRGSSLTTGIAFINGDIAVNNNAQTAFSFNALGSSFSQSVRTTATGSIDTYIGGLNGLHSSVSVANIADNGDVIGTAAYQAFRSAAVLSSGGVTYNLENCTTGISPGFFNAVRDVNASGDIVGTLQFGTEGGVSYYGVLLRRAGASRAVHGQSGH